MFCQAVLRWRVAGAVGYTLSGGHGGLPLAPGDKARLCPDGQRRTGVGGAF
ncbi:MAG: hypothetical protein IH988_11380 [Planctomycetes bacterium]|nr:hypothetical protein [Planctomycetota bacterium]